MTFPDQPPIDQAGRIFVPMRAIFERLGAAVVYSNGTINATRGRRTIALAIGSQSATVNGQPVQLDSPPFLIGERTLVPLRFVSQALGANVQWSESNMTAFINTNGMTGGYQPGYQGYQPGYGSVYGGLNLGAGIDLVVYVNLGPPSLPAYGYYEPPPPGPGYLWQPGYWGWGDAGWYWVPGTWMQPPEVGLYWTPGYWSWNDWCQCYGWNPGYWAQQVGFYGGINYGFGYYGNGYVGGYWQNGGFYYNRAVVTNVTNVTNVYYNSSVIATHTVTNSHVAFNGGSEGIPARPTSTQRAVGRMRHVPMTSTQVQHAQWAARDRTLLYNVNHGRPATVAVARPFSATRRPPQFAPVTSSDKRTAAVHVLPATRIRAAAATHHVALPSSALKYQAPSVHAAPVTRIVAPPVHAVRPVPTVHRVPVPHVVHPPATLRPAPVPHIVHPVATLHPAPVPHKVHPAATLRPAPVPHIVHPAPAHTAPHPKPKPHATPTPR
jgi:hypothetical protein